ncbi:MAG: hypothetical protein U0802_06065 [Candidatus Binatia bacterium]
MGSEGSEMPTLAAAAWAASNRPWLGVPRAGNSAEKSVRKPLLFIAQPAVPGAREVANTT